MSTVLDYSLSTTKSPANLPVTLIECKKQCEVALSDTAHDAHLLRLARAATAKVENDSRLRLICQTITQRLDWWPNECGIVLRAAPLLAINSVKYVDTDGATQTWAAANYTVDIYRGRPVIWTAYNVDWPSGSTRSQANAVIIEAVCGFGDVVTASAADNTLTPTSGTYTDRDMVQLSNYGGALPAGLGAGKTYYVMNAGTTFQLATSDYGQPIDITGAGTGVHLVDAPPDEAKQAILLLVSHWFETREPEIIGSGASSVGLTYHALIHSLRPGYYP